MSSGLGALVGDFVIVETAVALAINTTIVVAQPKPDRWSLMFSLGTGQPAVSVSTVSITNINQGTSVTAGGVPHKYNFRDDGALVNVAWFGRIGASPGNLTVTEVLYRPAGPTLELADLIEEFKKLRRNLQLTPRQLSEQLPGLRTLLSSARVIDDGK